MAIYVTCGNGGDWEWCRDKFLWETWIEQNMGKNIFSMGNDELCTADQICIVFEDPGYEVIFKLKAPHWISPEDIGLKGIV